MGSSLGFEAPEYGNEFLNESEGKKECKLSLSGK